MMYKIINNMVAINSENHFTKLTRKSRHVQNHWYMYAIPSATKDFRKLSFFVNTVKNWNNLPPDIATAKSLESFKAQWQNSLNRHCTYGFIQFLTLRIPARIFSMLNVCSIRKKKKKLLITNTFLDP